MINFEDVTIKELGGNLRKKKFSASELTRAYFKNIDSSNSDIGAYLSLDEKGALESAGRVDKAIAKKEKLSPLAGVPMAIKDAILVKGAPATAGSKILKDYIAPYDATVIQRLRGEDVVILGKTNMDEFAMGASGENSGFNEIRNPRDIKRVPGGSSGGSTAAVAGGMALGALGSDTGGSVRQPAAFCGVVGLKPTYGAVSRYGLIALASSLDQIGPIARTVEDTAILFEAMAGFDEKDSTSNLGPPDSRGYGSELTNPDLKKVKGLTIGIPEEYFGEGLDSEVASSLDETIEFFESEGFKLKTVSLPNSSYGLSAYYIVMPAEASTNLARYDGIRYGTRGKAKSLQDIYFENRGEGFGPEVKRRITLGTFVLSAGYYDAYYLRAQKVRRLIRDDFEEVFKDVDVLLAPTSPTVPFKFGERTKNPLQMYMADILTVQANLAGIPAISIPAKGREGKLPVGVQLMGRHWGEADILGLGMYYEKN